MWVGDASGEIFLGARVFSQASGACVYWAMAPKYIFIFYGAQAHLYANTSTVASLSYPDTFVAG
jgi:hypothetical protein